MKRNFQTLVLFHQFLILGTIVVQSITDSWMPAETKSVLGIDSSVLDDQVGISSADQLVQTIWWGLTLVSVLASVGVVLFRRWGRTLFVLTSIASLLLIPFGGLYVDVGLTVVVGSLAGIIEGMIIALLFFSPLRRFFSSGDDEAETRP